jgi:phosphotriesterase-related protein
MRLRAVLGDVDAGRTGTILPHEHLFCDLRPLAEREPVSDDPGAVGRAVLPMLEDARVAGVTLLVEPTPPGIGRDPLLARRLSELSFVDVVVATGLYKEPLLPRRAYVRSVEELADWFSLEISVGILPVYGDSLLGQSLLDAEALGKANDALTETPVRAGVIKLAASDGGLQEVEAKALRAAVRASQRTGAAIVSHSPRGAPFLQQVDVLEATGGDPGRLAQVHAHAEPDFALHLAALRRGAWLEYDAIGAQPDQTLVDLVQRVLDAGFGDRLLLSQDVVAWRAGAAGAGSMAAPHQTPGAARDEGLTGLAGTDSAAKPGGAADGATGADPSPRPARRFAYLLEQFLPRLRAAGVSTSTIEQLTVANPRRLLALAPDGSGASAECRREWP